MDKKQSPEELPFLQGLKKENPFIVPHNYFKELPDDIIKRIREEERKKMAIPDWSVWLKRMMVALWSPKPVMVIASLMFLFGLFFFWPAPQGQADYLAEFSREEISNYVLDHIEEFDENYFYSLEPTTVDFIGENLEEQELDILLNEIIEDLDAETIQNIL